VLGMGIVRGEPAAFHWPSIPLVESADQVAVKVLALGVPDRWMRSHLGSIRPRSRGPSLKVKAPAGLRDCQFQPDIDEKSTTPAAFASSPSRMPNPARAWAPVS